VKFLIASQFFGKKRCRPERKNCNIMNHQQCRPILHEDYKKSSKSAETA
jgi:hypothetical protein